MSDMTLSEYVERLQGSGRYTLTRAEALKATGLQENSFEVSVCRLAEKKQIVGVRRGFYVIVPVEYRSSQNSRGKYCLWTAVVHLEEYGS